VARMLGFPDPKDVSFVAILLSAGPAPAAIGS
jgi:hypothetical protein